MEKNKEKKIEFTVPKLVDLDDDSRIAGAYDCTNGQSNTGYCSTGSAAKGSGCSEGSGAACTSGHYGCTSGM